TPRQQVLIEPDDRVALRVRATFSDGSTRDVTRLAVFEPSNLLVRLDADGTARRKGTGETTILVRYLDRQATVQLAFVPAPPDLVWQAPRGVNYRRPPRLRQTEDAAPPALGPRPRQRFPPPRLPRHDRRPAPGRRGAALPGRHAGRQAGSADRRAAGPARV